jgi:DNA-binding transcriptional LysR family regulator
MELRHLRYFVAVAEELNFGRAAARLGIAQPPLSRQIQALESELAVRLFVRAKRRVQLTDAGRVLLEEARTALRHAERAGERARRAGRGELGWLAVAFAPAAELALIPRLIPSFVERHPDVHLELHAMDPDEHVAALQAGTIEAGLLPFPVPVPDDVVVERVLAVELCAVFPQRHRLASRPRVTLAMVAQEPLVLLRRRVAPGFHDALVAALGQAGVTPSVRCHATHLHTCVALVAAGLGVALLPAASHELRGRGVVYRSLVGPTPRLELAIVYRRDDPSRMLHAFLANERRVFAAQKVAVLACETAARPPALTG